jgi:hypothetical protein
MTHDDAAMMSRLRRLWERADPPPEHLADRVLFALELEDLDTDFELLRLTERGDALAGARGPSSDVTSVTFSGPTLTVMLTVSVTGDRRRVDGWIAPATRSRVHVHTTDGRYETDADTNGRFVLQDVPGGMLSLAFYPLPDADGTPTPFRTPTVEI